MKLKEFTLFTALVSAIGSALGADAGTEDLEESRKARAAMEKDKLARLAGWDRLVFLCSPPSKGKPAELFDRICSRTVTNARLLAASSGVKVQVVTQAYDLGWISVMRGMLRLEVDLVATDCSQNPCAVHATVAASYPYDAAVDQKARTYSVTDRRDDEKRDSPASMPRPILATMWGPSSSLTSGAASEEFESTIVNGIDWALREFFVDYLHANGEK